MDPRIDRLYQLLPTIQRMRDAEQGYPLQALLRVIAEQVNVVEDDIARLYDNWFIETAEDWAVPYIGDLVGYRPVTAAGAAADGSKAQGRALNRVLVPRREVANTLHYRRRKGTLKLLERLARDIAAWPAWAAEFYRLLGWNQNVNHVHIERARTVDVRRMDELAALEGPFDGHAHSVDVRRVDSRRTEGCYNIPSVGVFVWRLKSYSVTRSPACCIEKPAPNHYTFSFLGQDAPLFTKPTPPADDTLVAKQLSVPAPICRFEFARHTARFYGPGKSLEIWAEGWGGGDGKQSIPLDAIVGADLSDWGYAVPPNKVAVDPVLGRFSFPPRQLGQLPTRVRVSCHYGMSTDIGGGEYRRALYEPSGRQADDGAITTPKYYRVGGAGKTYTRVGQALDDWAKDAPSDAVIEVADSNVYVEPLAFSIGAGQTLQLRAASGARPALRLLDYNTDSPDPLVITLGKGSRFTLDGFLVVGRPMRVSGAEEEVPVSDEAGSTSVGTPICGAEVVVRHCTLVPGWEIGCDCTPSRPEEPSIELSNLRAALRIEHSIVGSIQVDADEVKLDPIPISICDSILDSTGATIEAIGASGYATAHALLTVRRSTVFGIVDVHAVELAENSIFTACINVARRQLGCMRFCYVPPGCRTPRRYHCQPDLALQLGQAADAERVRPLFTTERYGLPGYAQLARECAGEIKRGADDESEMGVFHDLFEPQRLANLVARLGEYTPAGCDVGVIFET